MLASATPVRRLVAPGPSVARQTRALPLSRPCTSAMNAAPCSWRVWRKWISESSSASSSASVSSPGTPKAQSTPSFSRQRTSSSAVVIHLRLWHSRRAYAIAAGRGGDLGLRVRRAELGRGRSDDNARAAVCQGRTTWQPTSTAIPGRRARRATSGPTSSSPEPRSRAGRAATIVSPESRAQGRFGGAGGRLSFLRLSARARVAYTQSLVRKKNRERTGDGEDPNAELTPRRRRAGRPDAPVRDRRRRPRRRQSRERQSRHHRDDGEPFLRQLLRRAPLRDRIALPRRTVRPERP